MMWQEGADDSDEDRMRATMPSTNAGQNLRTLNNVQRRQGKSDALFSFSAIAAYLVLGVAYYSYYLDWTVTEVVYFALATITTVGYGDFNGSADPQTMAFTMFYAFVGVGMIGLALGELAEAFHEVREERKIRMMEKLSRDISAGVENLKHLHQAAPEATLMQRFNNWSKRWAATRLLRIMLPVCAIGAVGAVILILTEEPDSDIMTSPSPLMSGLYVAIITGLSVGYGDMYPTSSLGVGLFIAFIPISVVVMLRAHHEINCLVRFLRTTVTEEIGDIRDILLMDESGDGQVQDSPARPLAHSLQLLHSYSRTHSSSFTRTRALTPAPLLVLAHSPRDSPPCSTLHFCSLAAGGHQRVHAVHVEVKRAGGPQDHLWTGEPVPRAGLHRRRRARAR
jgi:hypothetical protein